MGRSPQEKSDTRRALGQADDNLRATDPALLALCRMFQGLGANSQSTMAMGIFETTRQKIILIAVQAGSFINEYALPVKSPAYADYTLLESKVAAAPGLHAEMMVMRDLMLNGAVDPANVTASAARINLRIVCPEKQVCPDCGGYLRKHGIPHYPVACGEASPNWVHPRTGACFRVAAGQVAFYDKAGGVPLGNPVDAHAGNLGRIARIG